MRRVVVFFLTISVLHLATLTSTRAARRKHPAEPAPVPGAAAPGAAAPGAGLDRLPMSFEANVGQVDSRAKYLARGRGYTVFATDTDAVVALGRESLRVEWAGASAGARVVADGELPGRANYIVGSDSSTWHTDVPTYERLRYENVYDGVDAVLYGSAAELEYDFVVAPGADASTIRVRFRGARSVRAGASGDLVVEMANGRIRQQSAAVFQEEAGVRRRVASRYVVSPTGEVGFEVGEYDRTRPLVVDPVISFSDYLGGSTGYDSVAAIAIDSAGNAYISGGTLSANFPTTPGALQTTRHENGDGFVAKLDASGALVWATLFGGTNGADVSDIAVDATGAVYVAGGTGSTDLPTTPGAFDTTYNGSFEAYGDAFVAKLSPSGSALVYSTYLGGDQGDNALSLALASGGAVIVTGLTGSTTFPTTPGAFDTTHNAIGSNYDVFVTKVDAAGSALVYSTFISSGSEDAGSDVAVDASGAAYVAGYTNQADFPTTPGAYDTTFSGRPDAFVAKLDPTGASLVYSTFLGSLGADIATAIALTPAGEAWIAGTTESAGWPLTPGAFDTTFSGGEGFVAKLDAAGGALLYSTFCGGETVSFSAEYCTGLAVDSGGAAYVVGNTYSATFPTTAGAFDTTYGGDLEGFALKVSSAGALVYSTYLGGAGIDPMTDVAVDASGSAYVAGSTGSSGFPLAGPPAGRTPDTSDGLVTKLSPSGATVSYSVIVGGDRGSEVFEDSGGIARDAAGNVYVTGATYAHNFPTTAGAYDTTSNGAADVFVSKMNASGTVLLYSTYVGGRERSPTSGFDREGGQGIAVDASGAAYVVGTTSSSDFPVTAGALDTTHNGSWDGFAFKLQPAGNGLAYSTFVGGTDYDDLHAVEVDATGATYIVGVTSSTNYPTTAGAVDASFNGVTDVVVTKLNAAGSALAYSTYLGGAGQDEGDDIAIDASGAAFVSGHFANGAFPTTPLAFSDGVGTFATRLAPNGALSYSTTLRGYEFGETGVAVDSSGAAYYVVRDIPPSGSTYDVAVKKLAPDGRSLVYKTFVGGSTVNDDPAAIQVGPDGSAYVVGTTFSDDFPTTPGALDRTFGGGCDPFLFRLSPSGASVRNSTFLPAGAGSDFGRDLVLDAKDGAYVTGRWSYYTAGATGGFGVLDDLYGLFVTRVALDAETVGLYAPSGGAWFLRSGQSAGVADIVYTYGGGGALVPLAGDWDGDGDSTPGLYDPATGAFFLRNSNTPGPANIVFTFGAGGAGIVPIAGDWDGDGVDTIGLYNSQTAIFFLRNSNTPGSANVVFGFGGGSGVVPLAGDWDGDGVDTVGIYTTATGTFFLSDHNGPGPAALTFAFGAGGATPITGDWNGDGLDTPGLYDPATGAFFLRNSNSPGLAEVVFTFGAGGATPLAGNWDG